MAPCHTMRAAVADEAPFNTALITVGGVASERQFMYDPWGTGA